jgi:hypothetical protein
MRPQRVFYEKDRLAICRGAVMALPGDVREYFANRFRRRSIEHLEPRDIHAAMEVYLYAFMGEKPPRRHRDVIRPVLVALRLGGG